MQFKSFEPDVEVNGQTVFSIVDGLGNFRSLAKKYLAAAGIVNALDNDLKIILKQVIANGF